MDLAHGSARMRIRRSHFAQGGRALDPVVLTLKIFKAAQSPSLLKYSIFMLGLIVKFGISV